jgi:hypothetical protein
MSSSQNEKRKTGADTPTERAEKRDQDDLATFLTGANLAEFLPSLQKSKGVRNVRDLGKLTEKDMVGGFLAFGVNLWLMVWICGFVLVFQTVGDTMDEVHYIRCDICDANDTCDAMQYATRYIRCVICDTNKERLLGTISNHSRASRASNRQASWHLESRML